MRAGPPWISKQSAASWPVGSIRAEIYGKGGAGSDRRCLGRLVLWPAQEVGAVREDAGVLERSDVGEHPLTTTSAREGYLSTDCCGVVMKEKVRFGGPARRSRQSHGCRESTLVTGAHGAA